MADLLETIDQTSSVIDLHRSNLLRLQAKELVDACEVDIHHVKWGPSALEYMAKVRQIIEGLSPVDLDTATPSMLADRPSKFTLPSLQAEPGIILGLTKPSGNANVLATLPLIVKVPNNVFENKDYMRHRYFDVSKSLSVICLFLYSRRFAYLMSSCRNGTRSLHTLPRLS